VRGTCVWYSCCPEKGLFQAGGPNSHPWNLDNGAFLRSSESQPLPAPSATDLSCPDFLTLVSSHLVQEGQMEAGWERLLWPDQLTTPGQGLAPRLWAL
jgi:hypothetical protein